MGNNGYSSPEWIRSGCICTKEVWSIDERKACQYFCSSCSSTLDRKRYYKQKKWQTTKHICCCWCRISARRLLMIRSWRLWPCSAACRWPCLVLLTYNITASHRYKYTYTSNHTLLQHTICVAWCMHTVCVWKQCRQVKITIKGDEGVPVQVDGEAWIQPPGIVQIIHKNRAQMLTRDRVSVCDLQSFFFFP